MNKTILMSIHPNYIDLILSGQKTIEYRKTCPREQVGKILLYATNPVKRIVAEADCGKILKMPPKILWKHTQDQGGISDEEYKNYFKGHIVGAGIELMNVKVYDDPQMLHHYGIGRAPQSWMYI